MPANGESPGWLGGGHGEANIGMSWADAEKRPRMKKHRKPEAMVQNSKGSNKCDFNVITYSTRLTKKVPKVSKLMELLHKNLLTSPPVVLRRPNKPLIADGGGRYRAFPA